MLLALFSLVAGPALLAASADLAVRIDAPLQANSAHAVPLQVGPQLQAFLSTPTVDPTLPYDLTASWRNFGPLPATNAVLMIAFRLGDPEYLGAE